MTLGIYNDTVHGGLGRKPSIRVETDWTLDKLRSEWQASKDWKPAPILNQGNTGHCTGFALVGFLGSGKVRESVSNAFAHFAYYAEKILDNEVLQEDGSSGATAARLLRDVGRIGAYAWAQSVDDAVAYCGSHGPVVWFTDWYESMFTPDARGVVPVIGEPIPDEGHAYYQVGTDDLDNDGSEYLHMINSWGLGWGKAGHFWVPKADMVTIYGDNGEAMAAAQLPLIAA